MENNELTITSFQCLTNSHGPAIGVEKTQTWQSFSDSVSSHVVRENKDGPAFSFASFEGARRKGSALKMRSAIALDVEENKKTGEIPASPVEAGELIKSAGFNALIYTSFNHTSDKPRYRIVLQLDKPIKFSNYASEAKRIDKLIPAMLAEKLGLQGVVDSSKFGADSAFYAPSHPLGAEGHTIINIDGIPLDADELWQKAKDICNPRVDNRQVVFSPSTNGNTKQSVDEVIELLHYIPADCDYEEWNRVLMGLHNYFVGSATGMAIADDWSSSGSKYKTSEVEKKWATFQSGEGISIKTVMAIAKDNGADITAIKRKHHKHSTVIQEYELCTASNRTADDIYSSGFDNEVIEKLNSDNSEDGVAMSFAAQFKGVLIYSHTHKSWLQWDGTRWKWDNTELAFHFARRMGRTSAGDEKAPRKAAFANGVERLAKADPVFARDGAALDTDNYLLNTPDGTYDLRTMTRTEHDSTQNITKITAVAPCEDGGEQFKRFLHEITLGDKELENFLQVMLGATLSGAIEDHWLCFIIGDGRNGKNTLIDLVQFVLGDYSKKIPASVLMTSTNERHPTELANLRGVRLAVSSEVDDNSFWSEPKIKELSGDAIISARFMHGNFFEFDRTHKHIVLGNHRPQTRSTDAGLKSRLRIVPFKASFVDTADSSLPERLRAEAAYVLYWLMEGHQKWIENGRKLGTCPAVDAETTDYFAAQSTIDMWIEENCKVIPNDGRSGRAWVKASELYKNYSEWKKDRGEMPISQSRWSDQIGKRFEKVKSNGARYIGLVLVNGINSF